MCIDPMSMMAIGGAVISGIGGAMQAQNTATSYAMQAQMNERQAGLEREKGSYDAARVTEQGKKIVGAQTAGFAASGINASAGTAAEVIRQTGETAALDVAAVRYGSQVAQVNSQNQAKVNRFNSASASAAAPIAFLTPIIGAFTKVGTPFTSSFGTA